MASCRDANGSKTKEVPRLLVVEERRAPQLIVLGNRVVLEDVAPAARPPTMLCVTSSHNKRSMSLTAAAGKTGRRPPFLSV
jgi:hypothetical protein